MSENGHNGSDLPPRRLAALAEACLLISDARMYGLIDGGPEIDRTRCRQVLQELRREGCVASDDEVQGAMLGLLEELGAIRR